MSTFITDLPSYGQGPRVAVKDLIDVAGVITTAGSQAVADFAEPARADAALLAGTRAAGARIVGKANLHELAFGTSGVNPWAGTPENPLDPRRIPGGSSSGSAVAVATDLADVAIGSDTGGSIRVPAAFCGVSGLKTTFGRIPLVGVWPLAKSLDTAGPMAVNVAGLTTMMQLLEPGFQVNTGPATTVGRLRLPSETIDPEIDAAIDEALASTEFEVIEITLPEWGEAWQRCSDLLTSEAWEANRQILEDPTRGPLLGEAVRDRLLSGSRVTPAQLEEARAFQATFTSLLTGWLERVEVLALPTTSMHPPLLEDAAKTTYNRLTNPINLALLPALSLPVAGPSQIPPSLQLVGPTQGEALLLATASRVEAAAGGSPYRR
jgi:amidase